MGSRTRPHLPRTCQEPLDGNRPYTTPMADSPGTLRMLGQLSSVGMSFVLALAMGFGGGHWLDGALGTAPWLSFLGFFLGLAAGVLNVYRVMRATSGTALPGPGGVAGKPGKGAGMEGGPSRSADDRGGR